MHTYICTYVHTYVYAHMCILGMDDTKKFMSRYTEIIMIIDIITV